MERRPAAREGRERVRHRDVPDGRTDRRGERPDREGRILTLVRSPGAGFRLERGDGWSLEASPASGGWIVRGSEAGRSWTLRRTAEAAARGFLLEPQGDGAGGGARTTHATGRGPAAGPVSLLLGDGRLFWIQPRRGRKARLELVGWEVPGGYWSARHRGKGWQLEPTAAGCELGSVEEILILFAAEILDIEPAG